MMRLFIAPQDHELLTVKQTALNRVIGVTTVTIWIGVLAADIFFTHLAFDILLASVVSVILCLICWQVNKKRPHQAAATFILCALLMIASAAYVSRDPIVFSLFTGLVFVSASLLSLPLTSLVTVFSCLLIATFSFGVLPQAQIWLLMLSTIGGLLLSACVSRTNRDLLERLRDYQHYALEQLEASRDSRGELARTVKALTEAEERLSHLNIQLRHARNVAEEARRLKAQFAANVSHELRTPINLIVGFSEIIAVAPEIYGMPLAPNYRADIQAIYRNAVHLQNLINDILDIAQVESARLAIIKEESEPLDVINEAVAMIRELVESKGLLLDTNLPPQLPTMLLDRTRIRQVLLNLLANAARFTDQGSITVKAVLQADSLLVSVIDTGIGISEEELERVFAEFFQVESNTARRRSGTGLGLALSKQFITQHGGRMWAESEGKVGSGSTFSFTLPLRDAQPFHLNLAQPSVTENGLSRQVIIYDSDPNIVQLFKGYAQNQRILGSHIRSEIEALLSNSRAHNVIIADEKGFEEIRDVVQTHCPTSTIVISPVPSGKRLIKGLGITDYLVKPVSRQAILEALDKVVPPVKDILIIDNDRDVVRMFRRMLQTADKGYRVRYAYNGLEGLALMRKHRPSAVILDIMMPGIDGYSVIQMMNSSPLLHGIAVIVISAQGAGEMISEFASGEIRIINPMDYKPIELVSLIEAIAGSINIPVEPTL